MGSGNGNWAIPPVANVNCMPLMKTVMESSRASKLVTVIYVWLSRTPREGTGDETKTALPHPVERAATTQMKKSLLSTFSCLSLSFGRREISSHIFYYYTIS